MSTPKPEFLEIEEVLRNIRKYNCKHPCEELYGFDLEEEYDALVIAPGWKADQTITDERFHPLKLTQHAYISSYELEYKDFPKEFPLKTKIAWVQCASGASNLIDHLLPCGELRFKTLFFVGAVGALTEEYQIGDLCTPTSSIHLNLGPDAYLYRKLYGSHPMPFPEVEQPGEYIQDMETAQHRLYPEMELKKAKTFCTDSIALEYSHLGEIKKTGAELIEMETSAFLRTAPLFGVPYYILLAVSDNSSTKKALIGADTEKERETYLRCRGEIIPNMIVNLARNATTKRGGKHNEEG